MCEIFPFFQQSSSKQTGLLRRWRGLQRSNSAELWARQDVLTGGHFFEAGGCHAGTGLECNLDEVLGDRTVKYITKYYILYIIYFFDMYPSFIRQRTYLNFFWITQPVCRPGCFTLLTVVSTSLRIRCTQMAFEVCEPLFMPLLLELEARWIFVRFLTMIFVSFETFLKRKFPCRGSQVFDCNLLGLFLNDLK